MDSFDLMQIEDDGQYEAYQQQLELQQYLESDEAIEAANVELQILKNEELEQIDVDLFV